MTTFGQREHQCRSLLCSFGSCRQHSRALHRKSVVKVKVVCVTFDCEERVLDSVNLHKSRAKCYSSLSHFFRWTIYPRFEWFGVDIAYIHSRAKKNVLDWRFPLIDFESFSFCKFTSCRDIHAARWKCYRLTEYSVRPKHSTAAAATADCLKRFEIAV